MATTSWRALGLKAALRSALEVADVSGRTAAARLEVPPMRVQRWLDEDERAPSPAEVADLLAAVPEVPADERARILRIADAPDTDWQSGPPGINPSLATVLQCERYATRIFEFQLVRWPGLLHSSDYARAVISQDATLTAGEVESLVHIRNARRDVLTRPRPLEFGAVVGIPAVLGTFAGPDIAASQLRHVQALAERDNVTVQAVDLGATYVPSAPFIVYEFEDMPTTVFVESLHTSRYTVDQAATTVCMDAAETLRRVAMSPDATARLIADAIPKIGNAVEMTH